MMTENLEAIKRLINLSALKMFWEVIYIVYLSMYVFAFAKYIRQKSDRHSVKSALKVNKKNNKLTELI